MENPTDIGADWQAPGEIPARHESRPAICSAAKRWSELWNELDFRQAVLLGQARHVKADRYGPHLELIPQLFDLRGGRRFITVGIKYDTGPGGRRTTGSVGFGQFLNLAFADWAIADQLWELLQTGDMGVAFKDLDVINGNFDKATKASDQYEKDTWVQSVWELKTRLEDLAKERTHQALVRIASELRARPGIGPALVREGVKLPAALMEPDPSKEAMTRFRINQGMYGDHTYFIDRPVDGEMSVHGIPPARMFRRAAELHRDLNANWLTIMGSALEDLVGLTEDKEGASLARAIESADVTRKLNAIVGTFWAMWKNPIFSANAEFEVVNDHERRAAKYMDIIVQRALRILLKQAVEGIGLYPYTSIGRENYWLKVNQLREALSRASQILHMYAHVDSVPAFNHATREKDRLVRDFQLNVMGNPGGQTRRITASA